MAIISAKEFIKGGKPTLVQSASGSTSTASPSSSGTKKDGFLSRVGSDLSKRGSSIKKSLTVGDDGNINNPLRAGVRIAGQIAGGIGDVATQAVTSGFRALPDAVEQPIRQASTKILQTSIGQTGLKAIEKGTEAYQSFKQKFPEAAKDLEAVVNIASLLPIGKGTQLAGKGALNTTKAVGRGVGKVGEGAIDLGKKGLIKATDVVSPIESGVKTEFTKALKLPEQIKLGDKFVKYEEQARKAVTDYSLPTPLELAGREGESALSKLQGQLKSVGTQKKELTKTLADKPVGNIVSETRNALRTQLKDRAGVTFTKNGEIKNASGRVATISDPSDLAMLREVDKKLALAQSKPTFQRVDDTIDFIQDVLFKRKSNTAVPVNKTVESILKNQVKQLNEKLKVIGGKKYQNLNTKYSNRKKVFDELNKALGIEGNKGAALMKQLFSPSGTAPRKLFSAIKDYTGIDLVQEATLAKFVMENIGDVRQASLLEQVLKGNATSKSGLIGIAAEKVLNKIQNPVGKAKRIIQKRAGELNK